MRLQQHIGRLVSDVLVSDINAPRASGVSYRKRLLTLLLASGGKRILYVTGEGNKRSTLSALADESKWYRNPYITGWTITFPSGGSITVESLEHHDGLNASGVIIDDSN